jgi:hypothetical protein
MLEERKRNEMFLLSLSILYQLFVFSFGKQNEKDRFRSLFVSLSCCCSRQDDGKAQHAVQTSGGLTL